MSSLSSRALSRLRPQRVILRQVARTSSSIPPRLDDPNEYKHPQSFVKVRFEPGEWDSERRDPLHKPPFKSRAKIVSADDFAQRPRVGFEEEFDSLREGMITLSWMSAADNNRVYDAYLQLMSEAESVTSHEYIMRVLGDKFNISSRRAASIVELCHREEQYRKEGKKIYDAAREYVDARVREHIRTAYSEYDEIDPVEFVEDPMGVTGIPSPEYVDGSGVLVSDVLDIDAITKATLIREQAEARLKIDGYIYREDVDDNTLFVKLTKNGARLVETKTSFHRDNEISHRREDFMPMPGGEKTRRDRWKYAAQMLNTRVIKKQKFSLTRKQNAIVKDVIVEHDGEVRPASVAEIKASCWKPVRHTQEFIYSTVKAAWLERTLRGAKDGWGRQKAPEAEKAQIEGEVKEPSEQMPFDVPAITDDDATDEALDEDIAEEVLDALDVEIDEGEEKDTKA